MKKILNRKVLVTGASGFIGLNIIKNLLIDKSNDIYAVDNYSRGSLDDYSEKIFSNESVTFINLDLTNSNEYQRLPKDFDHIYHLLLWWV